MYSIQQFEESGQSNSIMDRRSGCVIHRASALYSNRKRILIFLVHILLSIIIFSHYGLKKYYMENALVDANDPDRIIKVYVPTALYATKHLILLQLAILPLTMCRYTIAYLSTTAVQRIIPFEEFTKYHIWVGYFTVFLVLIVFITFVGYYSALCAQGENEYCEKMNSEIMLTGYGIAFIFLLVGLSSFFRFQLKYRIFTTIHQVVFLGLLICIMHTIDAVHRSDGSRSQSYMWISASLLFYITDRATMYSKSRFTTTVEGYQAINKEKKFHTNGMVVLKLKKPKLFHFQAGQYANVKIAAIDSTWHPFSVASGPDSKLLEFFITIHDEGSWTFRLLELIKSRYGHEGDIPRLQVEIMGPYGTPIANIDDYSDALVIGSGNGTAPTISLIQQHIETCVGLDPSTYERQKERNYQEVVELAESMGKHVDSASSSTSTDLSSTEDPLHATPDIASPQKRRKNVKKAKNNIYFHLFTFVGLTVGVLNLGFTLSWNNQVVQVSDEIANLAAASTVLFQFLFVILIITKQHIPSLGFYIDLIAVAIGIVSDWYWFHNREMNNLNRNDKVTYSIYNGFILLRFWFTVCSRIYVNIIREANTYKTDFVVHEKMTYVFIESNAGVVSEMFSIFDHLWCRLENSWGPHMASEVCNFKIYCRDPDPEACQLLEQNVSRTRLYRQGNVLSFGKPSFEELLVSHSIEIDSKKDISSTLVAFSGSDRVGAKIKESTVFHDIWLAQFGLLQHHYEVQAMSIAGLYNKAKRRKAPLNINSRKKEYSKRRASSGGHLWNMHWESALVREIQNQLWSNSSPDIETGNRYHRNHHHHHHHRQSQTSITGSKVTNSKIDAIRNRRNEIEKRYGTRDRVGNDKSAVVTSPRKSVLAKSMLTFQGGMDTVASENTGIDSWFTASTSSSDSETSGSFTSIYSLGKTLGGQGDRTVVKECSLKNGVYKKFAVKLVNKARVTKSDDYATTREIEHLRLMHHPNILELYDLYDEPNYYAMIMELMVGGDVLDRIFRKDHYTEQHARTFVKSLLSAVEHCHSLKICHRDIKPENILLASRDDDTAIKLTDFEYSARAVSAKCLVTQCGSPLYVSPEILQGVPYGTKADCWSVGVVTYTLLAGNPPFLGDTSKDIFNAVKKGQVDYPTEYWEHITPEAKDFVACLLKTNPDKRYDATKALNHKWMTLDAERFIGLTKDKEYKHLGSNLVKLKTFNAKTKIRRAVFSLLMTNKVTSLGVRFKSSNAYERQSLVRRQGAQMQSIEERRRQLEGDRVPQNISTQNSTPEYGGKQRRRLSMLGGRRK